MNQCCSCNNKQIINNNNYKRVSFLDALKCYKIGKTIECRILNEFNEIVEWEKYNICEGLDIAIEFNEIINGQWYIIINGH